MPEIVFVHPDGREQRVAAAAGVSAMQAAMHHDVHEILAECGGNAMCATCHVYVREDQFALLPPVGEDEDALLDGAAAERLPTSRLSCQIVMTDTLDGLVLTLPQRQL